MTEPAIDYDGPRRQSVLVTGAARRIGRALALGFAARGWDVAVHHHESKREAQEVVDQIAAQGGRAISLCADLSKEDQVRRLVPDCVQAFGRLDCVMNCASRFEEDMAQTFTYGLLLELMEINVAAPLALARGLYDAIPDCAVVDEVHRGVVVNVLDQKLYNMNPDYLSYTLTKAALANATIALAQALAPKVRVVGLAPGLTLVSGDQTQEQFEMAHKMTPLRRGSRLEDIVDAAIYLAEARGVTGTTLVVDGGQHLVTSQRDVMFKKFE
ncbi:SDR family oxidoreductase [Paraburkholderia sp. CNPSo 3274]|uniref:SDR family oxidoreductase n=1 Tax=Paraburkholderia sp. CNPSo 3274 TaxID=2940932 RepID=UPI0020B86BC3|nr:SDR family oxidoreductase [Paraburkholderia sp. CNPSo 3274]MCP3713620.1 SDR family oxidoreductase [Paraburkholderia sp. CNPSo 3274]